MPTWCAGCGYAGVTLCPECAGDLSHWFRAETEADALTPGMPVWAAGVYRGRAAKIVLAWKSGHRPDLQPVMARLGYHLGMRLGAATVPGERIAVVPAPSGWKRRLSGNEVVRPLADSVARGIRAAGHPCVLAAVLKRRGGHHHHLSGRERRRERGAAITVRSERLRQIRQAGAGRVLLVDDVLTTGSTLAASAAGAAEIGPVIGAIVLALTPKPVRRGEELEGWVGNFEPKGENGQQS